MEQLTTGDQRSVWGAGWRTGRRACFFPGEDTVLRDVPQANGNDPIKGRNPLGYGTLFFLVIWSTSMKDYLVQPPVPLVVVKAVFLLGKKCEGMGK